MTLSESSDCQRTLTGCRVCMFFSSFFCFDVLYCIYGGFYPGPKMTAKKWTLDFRKWSQIWTCVFKISLKLHWQKKFLTDFFDLFPPFKRPLAPISQSPNSQLFRYSESLCKSNGKKWSQIWQLNKGCETTAQKISFFFSEFGQVHQVLKTSSTSVWPKIVLWEPLLTINWNLQVGCNPSILILNEVWILL